MTEEQQARLLAQWLEQPKGTPAPEGLDPEVVQSMIALRADLAPSLVGSPQDILDTLESGPLAAAGSPSVSVEETPARARPWWTWGGLTTALVVAAALIVFVLPGSDIEQGEPMLVDPVSRAPEPSLASDDVSQAGNKDVTEKKAKRGVALESAPTANRAVAQKAGVLEALDEPAPAATVLKASSSPPASPPASAARPVVAEATRTTASAKPKRARMDSYEMQASVAMDEEASELDGGIGGLVGAKGTQNGAGGLGSRGSGLGGGATAESIGGLGSKGTGSGRSGYGRGGGNFGSQDNTVAGVSLGEPAISGSIDQSVIEDVIKRHLGQISYCYQRELPKNPSLAGKIKISFFIEMDGTVSRAEVTLSTMENPAVESCIVDRVMKMKFPQPPEEVIHVVYPFIFSDDS